MAAQLAKLGPAELSKLPSMPPPAGATIDFGGPNPLETTIISVTSVFIGLAIMFVGIRAYTKIKINRKGSWDDQVVNEGFGRHYWNVPLIITLSDAFLKLGFISDWFCNVAYIFVKITFFILYWNIFKPFRWLKFSIVGGAIVVSGVYIAFTLANLIGATPRAGQTWLESTGSWHYEIGVKISIPLAAWSLVSDVFILLLPISGVLRLQLSLKKRLVLLAVFMTGFGACICSSLSLYYRTLLDKDVTYSAVRIQILIIVELCVGIYITCMPATSVFVRHILPSVTSLRSKLIYYSSKLHGNSPLRQSQASHGSNIHKSRAAGMNGPYRNLKDRGQAANDDGVYDLAIYPAQNVKTDVVAEPFGAFSDDGIHLRVDLEQG
ncbi:MAG: hypothetical protein ASARMPREDX12_006648 [Alectoria sarmentosa]|nr:MAG: hypothetical protein ASARMPREDX12_006648 [Alectoria sarmentosa]